MLVIASLVDGLLAAAGVAGAIVGYNTAIIVIPIYAFLALRRFAGQGRLLTLAKLVLLVFGYLASLALTLLGTLIVTVQAI